MPEGKRALVTGGAGFIGSHLVDNLLLNGWKVTALDDLSNGRIENVAEFEGRRGFLGLVRGDLKDRTALGRIFGQELLQMLELARFSHPFLA